VLAKNTIDDFLTSLGNEPWALALAIASMALALAFYWTAKAWFRHRERMARLEKGIDPDDLAQNRSPVI
jgi:hypothetical protein